jgi:hypothetical protein
MYEASKTGLETAQKQVKQATQTIRKTNRSALHSYLQAAFQFQRAGIESISALQRGAEEATFILLERAEEAQDKAIEDAEARWQKNSQRLRDMRQKGSSTVRERGEQLQTRLREQQSELEEAAKQTEIRLRDGSEIAMKVVKVIETRFESMFSEFMDMSGRQLRHLEERVDTLIQRVDGELEQELHPIPDYESKDVQEVIEALDALDQRQLRTLRAYEVRQKNRITVLRSIDEKLAEYDELN